MNKKYLMQMLRAQGNPSIESLGLILKHVTQSESFEVMDGFNEAVSPHSGFWT